MFTHPRRTIRHRRRLSSPSRLRPLRSRRRLPSLPRRRCSTRHRRRSATALRRRSSSFRPLRPSPPRLRRRFSPHPRRRRHPIPRRRVILYAFRRGPPRSHRRLSLRFRLRPALRDLRRYPRFRPRSPHRCRPSLDSPLPRARRFGGRSLLHPFSRRSPRPHSRFSFRLRHPLRLPAYHLRVRVAVCRFRCGPSRRHCRFPLLLRRRSSALHRRRFSLLHRCRLPSAYHRCVFSTLYRTFVVCQSRRSGRVHVLYAIVTTPAPPVALSCRVDPLDPRRRAL